jgi:hypothetical protein
MKNDQNMTTPELPGIAPEKRGRGRPQQYASAAEKQRAYRERLKAEGKRVVARVVRDVRGDQPLQSDIIDLSQVRRR